MCWKENLITSQKQIEDVQNLISKDELKKEQNAIQQRKKMHAVTSVVRA